ncbi:MAG: protein-(glutamine-N5) methyltransferase, release factor-specific [Rhizobiales bacterium 32-66-8]|nr:MAG: protein-(glutamine-N5) methyltransferase, release factor-specific [Rhizobiales bacterium 32-66-8]
MAARLAAAGIDSPDLDARLLLAHVLGVSGAELVMHSDASVAPEGAAQAENVLARRLAGEPVARILGTREFWSLPFALSAGTLVPRPDTEAVVEEALARVSDRAAPLRLLDLGIGSGAILAALLSELPAAFGVGVDRSGDAARTARDNLARLGLGCRSALLVGDWGTALRGGFDLIVSNPPYIPTADIAGLTTDVRDHDPLPALDGGADGLDAYRALIAAVPALLRAGGSAVFELGIGQEAAVTALARDAGLPVLRPARRDLGDVPRALTVGPI